MTHFYEEKARSDDIFDDNSWMRCFGFTIFASFLVIMCWLVGFRSFRLWSMTMRFSWSQSRAPGMQSFDAGILCSSWIFETVRMLQSHTVSRGNLIPFIFGIDDIWRYSFWKCTSAHQQTNAFASFHLRSRQLNLLAVDVKAVHCA